MLVNISLDQKIKYRKIEDLIEMPVVVRVGQFDDASTIQFASDFQRASATGQPVIPVVINSPGGNVWNLLSFLDIIKSSKKPVATICIGKAMSAGCILAGMGSEGLRFCSPNSTYMIHSVSSWTAGKIEEMKADIREAERLNTLIFEMLAKNCKKPKSYFLDLINDKRNADWFLSATEAFKHNLVDEIRIPTMEISIKASMDFV